MNQHDLDNYFRSFLNVEKFDDIDSSKNGIQVQNDGAPVTKIAFAVDACVQTIERTIAAKANMLFVHHGIFWGSEQPVTNSLYERLSPLIKHNIVLYAVHLPLDAHEELGNNIQIAKNMQLQKIMPFGKYHGVNIGFWGEFETPVSIDEAVSRLFLGDSKNTAAEKPLAVLPFGKKDIKTASIISGGGASELIQSIEQKIDLYITGNIEHYNYHQALESGTHVIAGGHYQTETFGIKAVQKKVAAEKNIETLFIAAPTGL